MEERLESPEIRLWKRHQRFMMFAQRFEQVFHRNLIVSSFHDFKIATVLRLQSQKKAHAKISLFQRNCITRLKRSYIRKFTILLFTRENQQFAVMYHRNSLVKQYLHRWMQRMFSKKTDTHHNLRRFKLKLFLNRWKSVCEADIKVKVYSTYLILKRSFLAMKQLRDHRLSNDVHSMDNLASSDRDRGTSSNIDPAQDSLSDLAQHRGRKSLLRYYFEQWGSKANLIKYLNPLLKHGFRRLVKYSQEARLYRQYDWFASNYSKRVFLRKLLSAIKSKIRKSNIIISKLLICYSSRGFRSLRRHSQRRLLDMSTLSQGMDYYLKKLTVKYFYRFKSSKKLRVTKSLIRFNLHKCMKKWSRYSRRRRLLYTSNLEYGRMVIVASKEKVLFTLSKAASSIMMQRIKEYQQICANNTGDKLDKLALPSLIVA